MNKRMMALTLLLMSSFGYCNDFRNDITSQIPDIGAPAVKGFQKVENVAQYGEGDWSNVIGIARGISLEKAAEIANGNPEITFFFHMKGVQMVLGTGEPGNYRVFRHGDAVFFKGTPWWGNATGFSDGYVKTISE
jgi:hypothetical protein